MVVVLAAGVAAGEWLRRPSVLWAVTGAAAMLAALLALSPFLGYRRGALATALAGLALSLITGQWQLTSIERHWPEQRRHRIDAAYRLLGGDLHSALRRADRLAGAAAATTRTNRETAFEVLDRLIPTTGPEMSVVVLDSIGEPWVWAGRHRLAPRADGDSIAARATGYYVELEARRHTKEGGVAIAGVLVWAHPAVPDRERSLAELFRDRNEVDLAVYPPGTAPNPLRCSTTRSRPRLAGGCSSASSPYRRNRAWPASSPMSEAREWSPGFCSPPSSAPSRSRSGPIERLAILAAIVWLAVRAPIGPALGVQPLFSPATFFRPVLGPLSSSAGVLALSGMLMMTAGVWLWRQRLPRRWYGIAIGGLLLLASPYVISGLGRGITPPADGVSVGLWLTWQLALLVAASALIVPTAALFRGAGPDARTSWRSFAGVAIAFAARGDWSAGMESARRMAGMVHVPVDSGAAPGDSSRAALGSDQRDCAGRGQLRRARNLGR